jgi:hypothetical protein
MDYLKRQKVSFFILKMSTQYRNVKKVEELQNQINQRKQTNNDASQLMCFFCCDVDSRSEQDLKLTQLESELAKPLPEHQEKPIDVTTATTPTTA